MSGPLHLTVDKSSPVPLYHQVAQGLEDAIRSGELPPGTKLDNEIDLANRCATVQPGLINLWLTNAVREEGAVAVTRP